MADLTDDARPAILLAVTLLTGHKRRRFQAEMANTYCHGSARLAETPLSGRGAIRTPRPTPSSRPLPKCSVTIRPQEPEG